MKDAISYRDAGVDIDAAEGMKGRLAALVESTRREGVSAGFGSFGGRFVLPGSTELVASADGVGTKVLVAIRAGRHDTVGEDLVNHCVNDILAEGAEPLFFLDYFACGRLDPEVALAVVEGVARGCVSNGCALLGGETAEMPGMYAPGDYDLAGFIVGRVVFDVPGADALREGDVLLGLGSNGLHTNGYSLARTILFDRLGLGVADGLPGVGGTVGEALLKVHRSYLDPLRRPCASGRVQALAHITGGGIPGNLARVLPGHLDAVVKLGSWVPAPEFRLLVERGALPRDEAYAAFNMGVGMIAVVRHEDAARTVADIEAAGCPAFEIGHLVAGEGAVRLTDV